MNTATLERTDPDTTDLKVAAILDTYLDVTTEIAARNNLDPGWCITAAALTAKVLPHLGFPRVKAIGVNFHGYNVEAMFLAGAGIPRSHWTPTAYARGTTGTGAFIGDDGWDGHVVAFVPPTSPGATAWVIDPSAPQFSDPAVGILIPPLRLAAPKRFPKGGTAALQIAPETYLDIERNPRLDNFIGFTAAKPSYIAELASSTLGLLRERGLTVTTSSRRH